MKTSPYSGGLLCYFCRHRYNYNSIPVLTSELSHVECRQRTLHIANLLFLLIM